MPFPNYQEAINETSPSTAGFAVEGGKAVYKTLLLPSEINAAIGDLLGSVTADGAGGLKRILPRAHPRWPWLYAARVSNILGLGVPYNAPSFAPLESTSLGSFAEYAQYLLTIDFEPLPFAVLDDTKVSKGALTWTTAAGDTSTVSFAREDCRFTDFEYFPKPELITAQQGQMAFYTQSGARPGAPTGRGLTFPGFLRMVIPQRAIKVRWYRVPYRYLESAQSYLAKYIGCINQIAWRNYTPGSLLYLGCTAKRYTPTQPALVADMLTGLLVYENEKVCDIELSLLHTYREVTDAPSAGFLGNANWVADGHNCMPWLNDRKFYYVAGSEGITSSPPTYLSVDFRLLFSDPDV